MQNGEFELSANQAQIGYGSHFTLQLHELREQGRIFGVIGHNGAGKSTLLKGLLDLLPLRSGKLVVREKGRDLVPAEHMAFCPESGSVFADISVREYLKLWCRVKHHNASYFSREGSIYLDLLDVAPLLDRKGRELSKGQRRRVQTVIGFLTEPRFFLFDEPFDGLDVMRSSELSQIIRDQSARRGFLISSHRMDVMEQICDRILVLQNGRVVKSGTVQEIVKFIGGQTYDIMTNSDLHAHAAILRDSFRDAVFSLSVHKLQITSPELEENQVIERLQALKIEVNSCERRIPTLTEAVGYRLSRVGAELRNDTIKADNPL